jgi:hypothetical protein
VKGVGDNLIAAGIGGFVGWGVGNLRGPSWVILLIASGILLVAGIAMRIAGRGEGLARLRIDDPAIDPEVLSAPTVGGGRVGRPVRYVRVRVTNTSRRITATVRATSSPESLHLTGLPLHWQHEREPTAIEEANITDNPPAILGPGQSGRLDLAIAFDDGALFAASILGYRAQWHRPEELRIDRSPCRVLIEASGPGARSAQAWFVVEHGRGFEGLAIRAA